MYKNLKAEMTRAEITQRELAKALGIHENSARNKLIGMSAFTVEEAFIIKNRFFKNIELDYLFRVEKAS